MLSLAGPLPPPDAAEPWRRLVRAIADRYRGRVKAYQLPARGGPPAAVRDVAFVLRLGAVEVARGGSRRLPGHRTSRSARPRLARRPLRRRRRGLRRRDRGPGCDRRRRGVRPRADHRAVRSGVVDLRDRVPLPPDEAAGAKALLDWQVAHLGGEFRSRATPRRLVGIAGRRPQCGRPAQGRPGGGARCPWTTRTPASGSRGRRRRHLVASTLPALRSRQASRPTSSAPAANGRATCASS